MRNKLGIGLGRRVMKNLFKIHAGRIPVIAVFLITVAVLPSPVHSFGSSNRRPPPGPPPQQLERQLVNGPGPNNRPPGPPPPQHIQSIKRQGLPFDDEPPRRREGNNNGQSNPRRSQNHPHGPPPPPHHSKHRGRPPFPFPRRRPPPPPPRGRGPPLPPRDRERERDREPDNNGHRGRRPPNGPPEQPPKLSFHIPPPPITTPQSPHHQQDGFQQRPPHPQQEGFQNRPPPNAPQPSESQHINNQPFNPQNIPQQTQFHQQLQHQLQQQSSQFNPLNNGNGFANQPPQFPNQNQPPQQFAQNAFGQQQQGPQPGFQGPPGAEPTPFQQFPPNGFMQQNPSGGPPNGFLQGQPGSPVGGFPPQGSSAIPPTPFQLGPQGSPQENGFQQLGNPQQHPGQLPGFPFENPQQPMPSPANPSHNAPFNGNIQLPPFQQQNQQPVFGQINPPPPSHPSHPILQHLQNNNPNNPPILEYAPPPNIFQSTSEPEQIHDKSKELESNSIPKQTITFTVTPKPSKGGGTQLHFKISTPKPFKSTLKPMTSSKGYFKGSTYRPPVDKLNSKFKYTSSNAGYPEAEYKPQDGSHRDSSMSAEMMPPNDKPRNNIKDLLMNREHSANDPSGPHPDDTDNYAGSSYEAPPIFVKPNSGERVLIAGVSGGKSGYHKGHHHEDFRGPGPNFEEDYDGPLGAPHHTRQPFGDDDEGGSKYSDRHLASYLPIKQNSFEEGPSGKPHGDSFRRPPFTGSHEGPFDEFSHSGKNRPRPHLVEDEGLVGSDEKHGRPKFSQPDPLYHPENDGGSTSKEREPSNGEDFDAFGFGGSGERRNKDKESSKNTAEELLAALGLSTNPLVSMPNSKYPVDIASKFNLPGGGSWEKEYNTDSERRAKIKEGVAGEPMGLLEYLTQKKDEGNGHSTEPLYSVPDRQIAGSGEDSFVVKGSMKTDAGSGENLGNRHQHHSLKGSVVMGRPIPQFQGSESSYTDEKVKGQSSSNNPNQDSYLYDKIHGVSHKHHGQDESQIGAINSGLYGPSVPPPIGEVGAFTNSPPVVTNPPTAATVQNGPGAESYLYQKIHGDKSNLAFGPTPTSPHSVEDQSGLYNPHALRTQGGLYSSPSEQLPQITPQQNLNGLVFNQGKIVNPQQQQPQVQQTSLSSGVLLPLGMGGAQQPTGLAAANTIPVNAPQQKPFNPNLINQQQQLFQQQLIQHQQQQQLQSQLAAQQNLQQPPQLLPQQTLQPSQLLPQQQTLQHAQLLSQQNIQQQPHLAQQQQLIPQQIQPQGVPQAPVLSAQQPQLQQGVFQQTSQGQLAQQPLQVQQTQQIPQVIPAPTQQQQHGALYGPPGSPQVNRISKVPNYSGEVGLQQPAASQQQYQQQPYAQAPNPYTQQNGLYQGQPQYNQFAQQPSDPSVAGSHLHHHAHPHQHYAGAPGVTPRYGDPYPVYVTEPDPIIEIIVQDSNMTLPALPTHAPPPPPPPPTPEPVHVFYVKYSQNNNSQPSYDYYGQASNPQIQLEQPISSVPVRGPDRNGMLPVDDSVPQASVQHQSVYNSVYSTTTESGLVATTPAPSGTTTLRTIIRPDRNEFAQGGSGLVVSFDNPAVEKDIFANYTNSLMQQQIQHQQQQLQAQQEQLQQQGQLQQQQQQQYQQLQQEQLQQQQNAAQYNSHQEQPQQQGHSYPDMGYPQQTQEQQQQMYPSLDSLWGGLTAEQKTVMEQQQQQEQMQAANQQAYPGFNKRIGLQELASLLETGPQSNDGQQSGHPQQEHTNENINLQDYHSMHQQNSYSMNSNDQNPPPLYQYVESQHHHQSTRQAKLPEDVPEELKNQLVKSGILGNADVQVINYSENLFKELSDLPSEALAAFQAHTGNQGQQKQLEANSEGGSSSAKEQSVWSGSQVSLSNTDLSSLMPSGRSLRSVLVVKNSLRPKRGGRQRRVVLLITNKDDVLLYKPKDRSLRRIGDTTSKSVIKGAIELSNHRMDDEESMVRGKA